MMSRIPKKLSKKTSTKPYANCIDCPHHKVIPDPDPTDWFNDDDVAVVCTKTKNPKQKQSSDSVAERQGFRIITQMCRPYQTKQESKTPSWCPLTKRSKKGRR
jgi:hypothetical protein